MKKLLTKLLAVLCLVASVCFCSVFVASAEGYKLHEIPASESASYPRMDGSSNELFSYVNKAIDWNRTEKVEISFCFAIDNFTGNSRHFAIVMNDITSGDSVDYTKLKFGSGGMYYNGVQFDFVSASDWNGCMQMQVVSGAGQVNSGAYSHGWGNQFGADESKGTKESGSGLANFTTLLFYKNNVKLTITADSEYYNFNFYSDNPSFSCDYTYSVKRNVVCGTSDFANAPYIGFYCADYSGTPTTDMGYNINYVKITEKAPVVKNQISVPFGYKTMLAGESVDYAANVTIVEGSETDSTEVTYVSSDATVAKVEDGKLVALKEGSAVITATTADGVSATTTVKIVGTLGDNDMAYVIDDANNTTVKELANGLYYEKELSKNINTGIGKFYLDTQLDMNKVINFDFNLVMEGKWNGNVTYFNFVINDLYNDLTGTVDINKLNINDPASNGLNGMQFRFTSDDEWNGWSHCLQFVKIAKNGNFDTDVPYSASFDDSKINEVAKNIWTDNKVNVQIISTADAYVMTITAYDAQGNLTENAWTLSYPKTLVEYPNNPYLGIVINNYGENAQVMGFAVTNFFNGYVEDFTINEKTEGTVELKLGDNDLFTTTQTYKVTPSASFDYSVEWTSSDEEIVKIENGKLVGLKPGNATITAKDSEGNIDTIEVAIDVDSFVVETEKTINALFGDEGITISATVSPSHVAIIYSSSDSSIVAVEDGKLSYVGIGTAVITVKAGLKSEQITVNVDVAKLELNRDTIEMDKFDVVTIQADCGGAPGVVWESSDKNVVTVDENGKVVAVGEGTATVTAKIGSKTATVSITVRGEVEIESESSESIGGQESVEDTESSSKDSDSSGCMGEICGSTIALTALMFGVVAFIRKKKDN